MGLLETIAASTGIAELHDVFATQSSRAAFQPMTGEPVVAVPFLAGHTVAVAAAVGPPAPVP